MEKSLHQREKVGVDDFVLLEDHTDENAFLDNLNKRFNHDVIYTYIGNVLVSVNPYKELGIYSEKTIGVYQDVNLFEAPPHLFAVTDNAYRSLREEDRDQCILISGESGAGKTEASKKVLHYIAAVSHREAGARRKSIYARGLSDSSERTSGMEVYQVRDRLVQSNPLLEALGNATTTRNDNSSRFGKYMDIAFDFKGEPVGGHILSYLLEKSRVVHQSPGERNFHIFYQLLAGAEDGLLQDLGLNREASKYYYLSQVKHSESTSPSLSDAAQFQAVRSAMRVCDISNDDETKMFEIVAGILHLGDVGFSAEESRAIVQNKDKVRLAAKMLGTTEADLSRALTNRSIEAKGDFVQTPLTRDDAIYARDALAKAVYQRLFSWVVSHLNESLEAQITQKRRLMGILDIYGFEVFGQNSFEQFCINYCNEKLQQLFIELTLKSEQEEYLKEGIEWTPVQYFNNKIICELIDKNHGGMISLLDEECLRPGDRTDTTFLNKINTVLGSHAHFKRAKTNVGKRSSINSLDEFCLVHYAGDVTYKVRGFLDKNNDLLFRDLKEAMSESSNEIVRACFPKEEILAKKRPPTVATQFKDSLQSLTKTLIREEPSYIRCIKPNDLKQPGQFNENVVRHQVKYLGLMENLRVRRAGFAYRRLYEAFLHRYKSLCPDTWPTYRGNPRSGVERLVKFLGYKNDEYRLGETKIFIRLPQTLFATEDAYQRRKHELATLIQKVFKGYRQKKEFKRQKQAAVVVQAYMRRHLAVKRVARRKHAALVIRQFIQDFIRRNDASESKFAGMARAAYLRRLAANLPRKLLDKKWPKPPKICVSASEEIRRLYRRQLARQYAKKLTPERKLLFQKKVLAEKLFKGKKSSYKGSIGKPFVGNRLDSTLDEKRKGIFEAGIRRDPEKTRYCTRVTKYNRRGHKPQNWILILTSGALYLLDEKMWKLKHSIPLSALKTVTVTNLADNFVLLRIPQELKREKGDVILNVPFLIEFIVELVHESRNSEMLNIETANSIQHYMADGKPVGKIVFNNGANNAIEKGKDRTLLVTVSDG